MALPPPLSLAADLGPVAAGILDDLQASPTPYHAVDRAIGLLEGAGFLSVDAEAPLEGGAGHRYLVSGGSLFAWYQHEAVDEGFLVVGAHTDSPNLRVRTNPDQNSAEVAQVGMEIYGGVLLNSWLDRDLGLAGRVSVDAGQGQIESMLFCDDAPILRIPQLAIHLDREIRDKGLKLDPQQHVTPMWALDDGQPGDVRRYVAEGLGIEPEAILAWDLMAFDSQAPAVVGRDQDLFASARIDNLVSAFAAIRGLIAATEPSELGSLRSTPVVALYDHEEIGSESATGAAGPLLAATLERIAASGGVDRPGFLELLGRSLVISADGAHATHPNYPEKHEPSHPIRLNKGVVIKRNANQRYATDATSEALVVAAARSVEVPIQYYIHRNDLPCGSTIGPITAARLGVATVDVGIPQLAMHSIREMAGLADLAHLHELLIACWHQR